MKISHFSQLGKRSNNEDSFGRSHALLTVCDGMGGHNYGERASAFVVDWMLQTFAQVQPLDKTGIQQRLNEVQIALNIVLEKEPELEKMGTTFTGIFRTPDVWYVAHIGDSRVYLFRPSERKLWHTWDHSIVGEMMRTHEITTEAGRFHPLSNRIAKAIIAQQNGKPSTASVAKIDELKEGDVLLLCSDGVVEAWGDWELVCLFGDNSLTFEEKCKKLAAQCNEKSKDNNTAIIAEIEAVDAFSYGHNDELQWTSFDEVKADYLQYVKESGGGESKTEPLPHNDEKLNLTVRKEEPPLDTTPRMTQQDGSTGLPTDGKAVADEVSSQGVASRINRQEVNPIAKKQDAHKRKRTFPLLGTVIVVLLLVAAVVFFLRYERDTASNNVNESFGTVVKDSKTVNAAQDDSKSAPNGEKRSPAQGKVKTGNANKPGSGESAKKKANQKKTNKGGRQQGSKTQSATPSKVNSEGGATSPAAEAPQAPTATQKGQTPAPGGSTGSQTEVKPQEESKPIGTPATTPSTKPGSNKTGANNKGTESQTNQ